jgi:fructosamine-3-kinase
MLPLHPEQPPQIYDGYQSISPLPSDFLERQPVYQLYTLLNRAILFGGQHLVTAQKALDAVLMEKAPEGPDYNAVSLSQRPSDGI